MVYQHKWYIRRQTKQIKLLKGFILILSGMAHASCQTRRPFCLSQNTKPADQHKDELCGKTVQRPGQIIILQQDVMMVVSWAAIQLLWQEEIIRVLKYVHRLEMYLPITCMVAKQARKMCFQNNPFVCSPRLGIRVPKFSKVGGKEFESTLDTLVNKDKQQLEALDWSKYTSLCKDKIASVTVWDPQKGRLGMIILSKMVTKCHRKS